jgi:tripartite-type tricarboxylate transporter receptor subunit TctC
LGQSVVVENKVGGSGVVGTQAMVSAPADGYTWAMAFDTHGVNPSLIASMPYDSKKTWCPDFGGHLGHGLGHPCGL